MTIAALLLASLTALPASAQDAEPEKLYAIIKIASPVKGDVVCVLHEEEAPKYVENFVGLATGKKPWTDPKTGKESTKPFYDGLTFHRAIPNYMIQGGDPLGNNRGGPGWTMPREFAVREGTSTFQADVHYFWKYLSENRLEEIAGRRKNLVHGFKQPGRLAMAPLNKDLVGGSQFFITGSEGGYWDGNSPVFGTCVKGLELVGAMTQLRVKGDYNLIEKPPVIETIKIERKRLSDIKVRQVDLDSLRGMDSDFKYLLRDALSNAELRAFSERRGVPVEWSARDYYGRGGNMSWQKAPPGSLKPFVAELDRELGLYSKKMIAAMRINRIVFASGLNAERINRPALVTAGSIYFDVPYLLAAQRRNPAYFRMVFHHEFQHVIDTAMGTLVIDDDWARLNEPSFRYMTHEQKNEHYNDADMGATLSGEGFLNKYAKTDLAEDKGEVFSWLVTNGAELRKLGEKDARLRGKSEFLRKRLSQPPMSADAKLWQ